MTSSSFDSAWRGYAVSGRPDFLNYLHRGDVTWRELWDYYRENPADPASVLRLTGLFHAFLCQDFETAGSLLDPDSDVCQGLRTWAAFAAGHTEFVPEEKLRESLTGLLAQSLISPLYYEAVFNVFLEASLGEDPGEGLAEEDGTTAAAARRLRILLPDLYGEHPGAGALRAAADRRHAAWNRCFVEALGEEEESGWDDGGEG
jgi:hypothetical protein